MKIYAVVILHESGIAIYRKFIEWEERPIEPLLAAIIGLAREIGVGSISHVSFEDVYLIVLRGIKNKSLLLSFFVDKVDHEAYIKGLYLLAKIEKRIDIGEGIITDDIMDAVKDVAEDMLGKLDKIPDFLGEVFNRIAQKYAPPFMTSLELVLFKQFGEDPLLVLFKTPKKFLNTLVKFLGEEAAYQFLVSILREITTMYGIQIDSEKEAKILLHEIRFKEIEKARELFRTLIERIIDKMLAQVS
ncbi:MAG: hypothetical protein ACTSX9_09475 [Candidatus Njordarchaeales archaeon]